LIPELKAYSIPPLIGTVVFFFLGALSLVNKPKSTERTLFSVLCFETFSWQVIWFASFYSSQEMISYLSRLAYVEIMFIPFTFYHFIVAYAGKKEDKRYVISGYCLALILTLFLFTSDLFVSGGQKFYWGYFPRPGPLLIVFMFSTFLTMVRGLIILNNEVVHGDETRRNQAKYLFFAFILYFLCTADFLQIYGVPFYPIGTFFFIGSFFLIAYAIFRHRLLDIRLVIRRTLFYALLAFLVSLAYTLTIFAVHLSFIGQNVSKNYLMTSLVSVLVIAILLRPIEALVQRIIDRKFFRGTLQEISEQKERLQTELERGERLKTVGLLAAGMAHEIKNPLTTIQTFSEYLPVRYSDPVFLEKYLKIVPQEIARIQGVVSELLEFSKPTEPNKQVFDIETLLNGVANLISASAMKANVRVEMKLDSASAYADPNQIKQALLNIMMNAIESMRQKGGMLFIGSEKGERETRIVVRDSGCGISKADLPHIFDPFFTGKADGTGLGLAITYSIIEKNSGNIVVNSEVGVGSEFVVSLPKRGS